MQFEYAAATDMGLVRSRNEDQYIAEGPLGLFAVVDGMGGHRGGEIASRVIADSVLEFIRATAFDPDKTWPEGLDPELSVPANRLQVAIRSANRRLADVIGHEETGARTGATISAALFARDRLIVSNVGDCRVYLLRNGQGWQITRDHSIVGEQLALGALSLEEARNHPLRHVVTRAVSGDDALSVDTWEVRVETGDRVLLCSDGVHGAIEHGELLEIASGSTGSLDDVCKRLLQKTNQSGGADNATVVLIEVKEAGNNDNATQ